MSARSAAIFKVGNENPMHSWVITVGSSPVLDEAPDLKGLAGNVIQMPGLFFRTYTAPACTRTLKLWQA